MSDFRNFLAALPGGIELQEAEGQRTFVNSTTLPTRSPWEELQKLGVVKGEPSDDLFTQCTLPDGWKKVPTDHSMWSELVDADGVKIASIFYKAAFYDRSAFLSICRGGE